MVMSFESHLKFEISTVICIDISAQLIIFDIFENKKDISCFVSQMCKKYLVSNKENR
jgi:hypothetical protein